MRADMIAWAKEKMNWSERDAKAQLERSFFYSKSGLPIAERDFLNMADQSKRDAEMLKAIIAELERLDAGEGVR